jgi:hypothetical protein
MRRYRPALLLSVLTACVSAPEAGERFGIGAQRFESGEAVLVDFEFDGKVLAPPTQVEHADSLITAQLMYAVGHLNADRSVPRFDRLELSNIVIEYRQERVEVSYHAKLPVAWGGAVRPQQYTLTLPARAGEADQVGFAAKYASTCSDPSGGVVDAGRMFLFYRPKHPGCRLDGSDIVRFTATVMRSPENTNGRYPEYHRVWEDGALDLVAVFGKEYEDGKTEDGGVQAHRQFLAGAKEYLDAIRAASVHVSETQQLPGGAEQTRMAATLLDGRAIHIDVVLSPAYLSEERTAFDDWYDARTPTADLVIYSGHAGLGQNVRTFMKKGAFAPGKYLIWVVNGCDTLAYLDRTMVSRRAALNPDDPAGTKYMDTVTNVLGGYFLSGDETTLRFVRELVAAGDAATKPKTYEEIFQGIDPEQVIVVTGEEDNEFQPGMIRPRESAPVAASASGKDAVPVATVRSVVTEPDGAIGGGGGCQLARGGASSLSRVLLAGSCLAALRRRRSTPCRSPGDRCSTALCVRGDRGIALRQTSQGSRPSRSRSQ